MNTANLKSFHYMENGDIQFSNYNTVKSVYQLDAGHYNLTFNEVLHKVELSVDEVKEKLPLPNFPDVQKLNDLFESFFNRNVRTKIKSLGILHKVGVLFYGQEGTGKSTIMKFYCEKLIKEQNALVFHVNGTRGLDKRWELIEKIRKIQNNPIVFVVDEFDMFFGMNTQEPMLKSIIDGQLSIDNFVFFASTNYYDRIPDALKNRQSRFKYCLEIKGIQNKDENYKILANMLGDLHTEKEIMVMAKDLEGHTLDQIKQFGLDRLMHISTYSSEKAKIGFLTRVGS